MVGVIGVKIGKIKYISQLNMHNCTLLPLESWVFNWKQQFSGGFISECWLFPTTTDQCLYNTGHNLFVYCKNYEYHKPLKMIIPFN